MEEQEEEYICDVCQSCDTAPDDVMIKCDACNVSVHASCYSVRKIPPEGVDWFCYPCRHAFQPSNLLCGLCNHSGGAFKAANAEGSAWVHCLCASWIPELGEDPEKKKDFGPVVKMEWLVKARQGLKCVACRGKMGSVQCAHQRCLAAIHPHCMLKKPSDFSWRVVECQHANGTAFRREVYCANHADDVGLPLKKKGELLILVDPHSKFEYDDQYMPVLKEEYLNDPAYAHLVHAPTDSSASAAAPSVTPAKGKRKASSTVDTGDSAVRKRKRSATEDDRADRSSEFRFGVPSKRPKAAVISAVQKAAQTGASSGSSSSAVAKSGDKRAPSKAGSTGSSSSGALVVGKVPGKTPASAPAKSGKSANVAKEAGGKGRAAPATEGKRSKRAGKATAREAHQVGTPTTSRSSRARTPVSPSQMSLVSQGGDSDSDAEEQGSGSDAERASGKASVFTSGYFSAKAKIGRPKKILSEESDDDSDENDAHVGRKSSKAASIRSRAAGNSSNNNASSGARPAEAPMGTGKYSGRPSGAGANAHAPSSPVRHPGLRSATASPPLSPIPSGSARASSRLTGLPASEAAGLNLGRDITLSATRGRKASTTAAASSSAGIAALSTESSGLQVGDGAIALHIDAHTLEVLRRALLITIAPTPAAVQSSHTGTNTTTATSTVSTASSAALAATAAPTSAHAVQPATKASETAATKFRRSSKPSLPAEQWAALEKAGWVCLESCRDNSSAAPAASSSSAAPASSSSTTGRPSHTAEEIFVTPGTLPSSASAVVTFDRTRYVEGLQYFPSADALRTHLAQNPFLLRPWEDAWKALGFSHGWKADGAPGTYARVEDAVRVIYLSGLVDGRQQHGSNGAGSGAGSEGESDESGEESAAPLSGGGNFIDGVHRFTCWKDIQTYIHRFPYLLQDDATLTNTLLRYGWKHRLCVKPERAAHTHRTGQRAAQPARHSSGAEDDSAGSDAEGEGVGTAAKGVQAGLAALGRTHNEFLWQSAHILAHMLPASTRGEMEDRQVHGAEAAEGVWLNMQLLRRHLWIEPQRLFQPYDRTLVALRVGGASNIAGSNGNSSSSSAVYADPAAEIAALRAQLAHQTNLASTAKESHAVLAQQNAALSAARMMLEAKLAKAEERRRRRKEGKGKKQQHAQAQ